MPSPSLVLEDDDNPLGVRIVRDHEEMSRLAAAIIIDQVRRGPDTLLGVATGSTPTRTYALLSEAALAEPALFKAVRIIKLDEWYNLDMDDPATCEVYLREKLLRPLGVTEERYCGWDSQADNSSEECVRVQAWLRKHGPIDLCVLGLGLNGHLGFNEPGEALRLAPHVPILSETSLRHPMLERARRRPMLGLTLGIGDILDSSAILLLISGAAKREAFARLVRPEVTAQFPASFLWLHRNVTVLCDVEAWCHGFEEVLDLIKKDEHA